MKAPLPENEAERLARLRDCDLLDTAQEAAFDRIVRLATRFFSVPMAAISLVDENRQWFKAAYGMQKGEVARDYSFCAHAILGVDVFVVRDALKDTRFADNPQVLGPPHLRFYAGAPLKTADGLHLGSLCVLDTAPRRFSVDEGHLLAELAAVVVDGFGMRQAAGSMCEEVETRARAQRALTKQHRMLRRLSGSLEERVLDRTTDLLDLNQSLREEIARRQRAELDLVRLDRLAEESRDLIGLATLDGYVTYLNEGGRKLVGIDTAEEARRTHILDYFPADKRALVEKLALPEVLRQGRWEADLQLRHFKSGALIPVSWNVFVVRDPRTGEPMSLATVTRDITQRKASEAALNQAKEEAERANHAKNEFLSRMSHELRTPLNAILGFGQLLDMHAGAGPQKEYSTHIVSAGRHLLNLINEVLDISQIESGHVSLRIEPVRVADAVAETIDLIRPLAGQREILLKPPTGRAGPDMVLADRKRFKQVLLNLLSNAVKYNIAGGRVDVSYEPTTESRLRVYIKDTGPGIPSDKLPRLFIPFERLGAEHSGVPGTGLGLALSKHLMEALGGDIGVESSPGTGSTFWLELPRSDSPDNGRPGYVDDPLPSTSDKGKENPTESTAQAALPAAASTGPGEPGHSCPEPTCTVLYIEDNTSNLRLMEHLMRHRPDVRLLSAPRAMQGLALAGECKPALILLDLHLPDMSGWEVIDHLRASTTTGSIPVVVISADASPTTLDRLRQADVQAFLTKPFDLDCFLDLLPRPVGVDPGSRH